MNRNALNRREFLRRGGMAVTAGAALPLLGQSLLESPARAAAPPSSSSSSADPDELLQAGLLAAADRGYARQLLQDPGNAHALTRRGYIALLSNRFGAAEQFLTQALQLTPGDTFSQGQLADCYVRQDQLARAVPVLDRAGSEFDAAAATQYAAVAGAGDPYQVTGPQSTRVPLVAIDPLPVVEASLNGSAPQAFDLDTGAGGVGFTTDLAGELGLAAVASITGAKSGNGQSETLYFGVLESFRIGEIEVRNIPVTWADFKRPSPVSPTVVGAIGTVFFYHFLTTIDYQAHGFILRRKSQAGSRRFRAAAMSNGHQPLPLWLPLSESENQDYPCTLGSLNDFGPHMVSMDTGGQGIGVSCSVQVAQEAGIMVDYGNPVMSNGKLLPSISPDKISLGRAVGRHVLGVATSQQPGNGPGGFLFDSIANFTHEFFKPFALTFDFLGMNLYVTPAPSYGS